MRLDKLTTKFQEALADAQSIAVGHDNAYIDPSHVLLAMLRQSDAGARLLLQRAGVNVAALTQALDGMVKRLPQVQGGDSQVQIVDVANASNFRYRGTTIVWNSDEPEAERMAELVAAAIPDATVKSGKTKKDVDVAVIVGKGKFSTTKITQILPIPIPKPGTLPEVCAQDQAAG